MPWQSGAVQIHRSPVQSHAAAVLLNSNPLLSSPAHFRATALLACAFPLLCFPVLFRGWPMQCLRFSSLCVSHAFRLSAPRCPSFSLPGLADADQALAYPLLVRSRLCLCAAAPCRRDADPSPAVPCRCGALLLVAIPCCAVPSHGWPEQFRCKASLRYAIADHITPALCPRGADLVSSAPCLRDAVLIHSLPGQLIPCCAAAFRRLPVLCLRGAYPLHASPSPRYPQPCFAAANRIRALPGISFAARTTLAIASPSPRRPWRSSALPPPGEGRITPPALPAPRR